MNNLNLGAYLEKKEEKLYDIVKEIAYRVEQKTDHRTVLKFLGLTKGWDMHDIVMMREELPKRHPAHFWNKYNELKARREVSELA